VADRYCRNCRHELREGDRFCPGCGRPVRQTAQVAGVPPDAQHAAPTQEIPTQVYPPPNVSSHEGNRTLAVVLGVGALLVAVLAVGAIVGLNLLGSKTAERSGEALGPAATMPKGEETTQVAPQQDEEPETLGVGDSVEVRGVRATLNEVRTLPTTDLDQPLESPDNLFVATDLTFENTSDETVAISSLLEFILKDEDGYSASQTVHSQQRQLAEGDIAPGDKSSGEIVYEVPPESKGLQLDYNPFLTGEVHTWEIGDASQIPGSAETPSTEVDQTEGDLVEAVEDYYQAVDQEDWAYTYQNLDSQTRAVFDEEEWYLKNQWFADTEGLELATMDVTVNGSPSDSVVSVNVYRTFTDDTVIDRETFFVFEDGVWKHRFGEEEIGFFMPEASFEEFVASQQGSSPSPSASAAPTGGDEEEAVEEAVRGHYEAIGRGDFEEAYSYFGPTMRSRQDEASWIASEESYQIQSSKIHSLTVDEVLGTTATATVDVSFVDNTGTPRFVITWGLVKEGGQWKLDEQISSQTETKPSASLSATPSASPSATPSASPGSDSDSHGGDRNRGRRQGRSGPSPGGGDIDCDEVNGPVRVPPGDPNDLDRDGNGWGCE
jgi:hypothetical protein